jgi:release factor H-coupled RctB family protein
MDTNRSTARDIVRLIASAKTWIEGEALRQLEKTAELLGMRLAVGMPDLHPGKGNPIGAAFATEGVLYPHLVGSDIGCGMALWGTDLATRKIKRDRWAERLSGLESTWDGDVVGWLAAHDLTGTPHDLTLGTIGGGNHFAELQQVHEIADPDALAALGLGIDKDRLLLLVHSGSRGLGESVLREHAARHGAAGLVADSEEARGYLSRHDHAVRWAQANRALIAGRFLGLLGAAGQPALPLVDVCHNSVTPAQVGGCSCWLHRKGAAPSDKGPVVIPGSRGTLSYLVLPEGDGEAAGFSLAHGAGRKWKRSDSKARLSARYRPDSLLLTELGSRVICEDRELLYEEAPQAYKDIDSVVGDLVAAGLCRVLLTLRPIITYKTRS